MCTTGKTKKDEIPTKPSFILPAITQEDLERLGYVPIEHKISNDPVTLELIEGALKADEEDVYRFVLIKRQLGFIFLGQHNSGIELEIIVFEGWYKNKKNEQIKFFTSKNLFVRTDDPKKEEKERLARGFCLLLAFFEAHHI